MPTTYTLDGATNTALRSSDGARVPWDLLNDRPADILGLAGRIWAADGSPPSIPASAPAPAVPEVISDRQCFQQLAIDNHITQDEALAAVTVGALPKAVSDGIAALPADQQFGARMLLCGATEFHRSHPMVPVFLGFFSLNATTDRDALWTTAAAL